MSPDNYHIDTKPSRAGYGSDSKIACRDSIASPSERPAPPDATTMARLINAECGMRNEEESSYSAFRIRNSAFLEVADSPLVADNLNPKPRKSRIEEKLWLLNPKPSLIAISWN